ncbi:unnamed protein product [Schistosoma rodhaini]|uniref:EF-hand domain-containing protein n=1 Tax=Schistosoma rodhaini TaxID=6188 RepID=A0AA85ELL9_9TREM|nr:unnamed protein product [Schistosoma rodhaini]CAH8679737.1 unnamed protein product [Schistosoma rodhaini]
MSDEEILLNLFTRLDTSGDGVLSLEELRKGLLSSGATENVVTKMIEKLDSNSDSIITYQEYIQAINRGVR